MPSQTYPDIEVVSDWRAEIATSSRLRWVVMAQPSVKRQPSKVFSRIGVLVDGLDKQVWSFLEARVHPSFVNIANMPHSVPVLQAGANNLSIQEGIPTSEFDMKSYTETCVVSSPHVVDLTELDFANLLVSEKSPFHWYLANPVAIYSLVAFLRQTEFVDEAALKVPGSKLSLVEANLSTMSDLRRNDLDALIFQFVENNV